MLAMADVTVNTLLAMSEQDLNNSGEPGPQAQGVNPCVACIWTERMRWPFASTHD